MLYEWVVWLIHKQKNIEQSHKFKIVLYRKGLDVEVGQLGTDATFLFEFILRIIAL